MFLEGGTEDAILQRFGEGINVGISKDGVRNKLLMLVGEEVAKRGDHSKSGPEEEEVELDPLS